MERLVGPVAFVATAVAGLVGAARDAAAACVSAQAGRAVARVNCDNDGDVVAGQVGGNLVVIKDDDDIDHWVPVKEAPLPAKHAPIPLKDSAAKPDKGAPEKPPKEDRPADDRAEREPPNREPRDGAPEEPRDGRDGDRGGDGDVTVDLDCEADPETTTVTNNGAVPITVQSINPTGGRSIERDDVIEPGESVTYESGDEANGRFALGDELYADNDREAGVELSTTGGDFDAFCFAS